LNVNSNELPNLLSYLVYRTYKQPKEYFLKNGSEFGSRLSSTRDFFGVKPDGKITKNQIINYIKSNKNDIEVDFVLGRWVAMDFPPIEDFLNDINSFAMSDFNKSNKDSFG
jgi:serine protease inhibitor